MYKSASEFVTSASERPSSRQSVTSSSTRESTSQRSSQRSSASAVAAQPRTQAPHKPPSRPSSRGAQQRRHVVDTTEDESDADDVSHAPRRVGRPKNAHKERKRPRHDDSITEEDARAILKIVSLSWSILVNCCELVNQGVSELCNVYESR